MSRLPRAARLGVTVSALVAVAAVVVLLLFPSGASSAIDAATSPLRSRADPGTVRVLTAQAWGTGELVLARFDRHGERMLRLAYSAHGARGWRPAGATERRADINDVAVASLLVARSPGGKGQPAWSAAAGELGDRRIARVEITWASGPPTVASRQNDSYLAVRAGTVSVTQVRFLSADGREVAKVPVSAG